MTAAHPLSAALTAGSGLTYPNHAVKIDAVLLACSLGTVCPAWGRQSRAVHSLLHFPHPHSTVSQLVMSDWYQKHPLHGNEIVRKEHLLSGGRVTLWAGPSRWLDTGMSKGDGDEVLT